MTTENAALPQTLTAQHKLVIYLLLSAAFVVMLNETIVSVALPRMRIELGIEPATLQWLVTAFMLTMAVVIPLTGFLMKRYTTRQIFIGATALFVLGTALAAGIGFLDDPAVVFPVLVVARVIQAAGTGVMTPLLMTTIMTLVPPHQRGRMMGNISIVMAAAPVIGPLVGGLIVSSLPWHWIFIIVLPFAIVALLLGIFRMENVTETARVKIDVLSIILSALAFAGLIYGLSEFGTEAQAQLTKDAADNVAQLPPWIPLAIGAVALLGFVFRQLHLQKTDNALIDLRVFSSSGFTRSIIVMTVSNLILFGSLVLLPFYIQNGIDLGPLESALIVLPGGLLMGIAGPFVGIIYDRVGPKPLVVPGAIIVTIALALMAMTFSSSTPWWGVAVLYLILAAGLALQFGPLFTASLGSVPPKYYSFGSATLGTLQQLAGAAGTSLFIVIFTIAAGAAASGTPGTPETSQAVVNGTVAALYVGAAASIIPIILAFFIKRPESEGAAPVMVH